MYVLIILHVLIFIRSLVFLFSSKKKHYHLGGANDEVVYFHLLYSPDTCSWRCNIMFLLYKCIQIALTNPLFLDWCYSNLTHRGVHSDNTHHENSDHLAFQGNTHSLNEGFTSWGLRFSFWHNEEKLLFHFNQNNNYCHVVFTGQSLCSSMDSFWEKRPW